MIRNPLLVPDLRELIQAGEAAALREFFAESHPARVAEMIQDLDLAEGNAILEVLDPRVRAEVVSYLDFDRQIELVEKTAPADAAALLHLMSHDDRANLVKHLDEDHADEILRRLAHAEREDIRRLASYEPGTAGAVMTTDYATLSPHLTVREALDQLRQEAPDRETIDYSYVVDINRKLIGLVPLKKLILARPTARIEDIMRREIITARVDEDQESVVRKIAKFDLVAIPVVDPSDMLVGIVTHDDAFDILRREQTEDILAFGGVSSDPEADDEPYWQGRVTSSVRRRIKWLLMLFLAENFTYPALRHFKWVEHDWPMLTLFLPLLLGTGGNAGSQTVGTIIRGLALGEITRRHFFRVLAREWFVGFMLGAILGVVAFCYAWLYRGQSPAVSAVIGLTILGICMWANLIGALVPMIAHRLGWDPAVVSAPAISTLVDATGIVLYYSIAILLLMKFHMQ